MKSVAEIIDERELPHEACQPRQYVSSPLPSEFELMSDFCPVCKKGLKESLERIISAKKQGVTHGQIRRSILRCKL